MAQAGIAAPVADSKATNENLTPNLKAEKKINRRSKLAKLFTFLGIILVLGAAGLFGYNNVEDFMAGQKSTSLMAEVKDIIRIRMEAAEQLAELDPYAVTTDDSTEMTEVEIDGYMYVGYVSLPSRGIELPVMSVTDDTRLKIAPCRYSGSTKTDDLVICAHSYRVHFGSLWSLTKGDRVIFTDMDGGIWTYEIADIETLGPYDVNAMTHSEYDLTLFTCTYGGQSRVTVRCDRISVEN